MSDLLYRKNVAAFVLNEHRQILICERSDIPGAWQVPQGGIDEGETPEETLRRELMEETGISKFKLIGTLDNPISYDWPKRLHSRGYKGQEQYYFLIQINSSQEIKFDLDPENIEFLNYKWVKVSLFPELVSGFKKAAYLEAIEKFKEKNLI